MFFPIGFLIETREIAATFKEIIWFSQFLDGFLLGQNEVPSLDVEFLKPGIEFTMAFQSFSAEEPVSASNLIE